MKLKTRHIRQIQEELNSWKNGYRGYRKEIAVRVYENGDVSLNYDLHPDMDQDLHDIFNLDQARGCELDLREGYAELDIWLYQRDWLHNQVSVYVRRVIDDHLLVSTDPKNVSDSAVLREAVRLAAGK